VQGLLQAVAEEEAAVAEEEAEVAEEEAEVAEEEAVVAEEEVAKEEWATHFADCSPDCLQGYCNSAEDFRLLMESYCQCTASEFTKVNGTSLASNDFMAKKHKVLWSSAGPCIPVPFMHKPFLVVTRCQLECHHGKKKKTKSKEQDHQYASKKRRRIQPSKKVGCPAKVQIVKVAIFPDFEISVNARNKRDRASKLLRCALAQGESPNVTYRVYAKLPKIGEHKGHGFDEAETMHLSDKAIVQKIQDCAAAGINRAHDVEVILQSFVQDLFHGKDLPSPLDRRYFPSCRDILNIIASYRKKTLVASTDQERVGQLVGELEKGSGCRVFFRPYGQNGKQRLLFMYQSEGMRHLVNVYADSALLLDATYKVVKYEIPFFQVVVQTNCGFQVAAVFIVQHEDGPSIAEALGLFRRWNCIRRDPIFVIDHSIAELNAITNVWPDSQIFFCSFHREQAWDRWLRANCSPCNRDELRKLMRAVAHSANFSQLQGHLMALQDCCAYDDSVASWFESHWLKHLQRWAQCFHQVQVPRTTNGVESLHRILKYKFLAHYNDRSLHGFLGTVTQKYLSFMFQKYRAANLVSKTGRPYDPQLPDFLINRPLGFVRHCVQRIIVSILIDAIVR
ncbi:hypothetical protein CAPTEDRAFT_199149, partial [Capitella teleta]